MNSSSQARPLRLAILGMHLESGTFSPLRTLQEDFYTLRGPALMDRYPFVTSDHNPDLREAVEWLPLAHFRAIPGGKASAEAYSAMRQEVIEGLEALTADQALDGVYLDVHGAMTVEGLDDAELDLLKSVREVVGYEITISCSQDLHGNVSAELVEGLDYITTYRTAPHTDFMETRERAMKALVRLLRSQTKITKAWCGIPMVMSGEMTSTTVEPGTTLWRQLVEFIDGDDIWEVALWAGYPWADQPRVMASVVVTGENAEKVKAVATQMAQRYWDARDEFDYVAPEISVKDCFAKLNQGELLEKSPLFLSDAGDNPTGGGAGDTTGVLDYLIKWTKQNTDKKAIFSNIADAKAVQKARETGVGNLITLEIGGKLDYVHSKPLTVSGTVRFVGNRGGRWDCDEAVIECAGASIILSSKRRPYHVREDYVGIGLDPLEMDIVVVKIGYLEPELKAMAQNHLLLLSDGSINPDVCSVAYTKLQRPIFPLDREFTWSPKLSISQSR